MSLKSESYELQVHNLFTERHWTLSFAESCTGGAAAARITALPGCSKYFLGSVVAYSNALKIAALAVQATTLKEKGAVSEETVKEMVAGMLTLTNSDFSVAVTGIAGPEGGAATKPAGTVWYAIGRKGRAPKVSLLQLDGNRAEIINGSVNAILQGLLEYAKQELAG